MTDRLEKSVFGVLSLSALLNFFTLVRRLRFHLIHVSHSSFAQVQVSLKNIETGKSKIVESEEYNFKTGNVVCQSFQLLPILAGILSNCLSF